MVVLRQIGCILGKWLYSGKVVVFRQKLFYSCKCCCIRAKVVVIGQKLLHSGKMVVFGKNAKVIVFGQSCCI